jgi:secreted Zn-dependent insulinase-like peptidase
MLSRWQAGSRDGLHLPDPNPFIAEDVELVTLRQGNPPLPEVAIDAPRKKIWFRQSEDFRVPKGALYLSFRSPLVSASAKQKAAASLYTRLVSDAVNEYTYPALLAGLGFNFYNHAQGISLRVSGYDDKQLMLLERLLESIAAMKFDVQRFDSIRRDMVLELQNTVARRPSSQLIDDLRRAIGSGVYDEPEMIEALEALTPETLESYRKSFWASVRAEGLLYGNYEPEVTEQVADLIDALLESGEGEAALAPTVLRLGAGDSLQLESSIEHDDAVVAWYLQGAGQSWEDRAAMALTAQIVQSGFFQQLRTEQQLGYIVSSFAWPQYNVPALMLLVQSPSHAVPDVYRSMRVFLDDTLAEITQEQYLRHQQSLLRDILKPHENLGERAEFYWQSIAYREWGFDTPQQLAAAVEQIDFARWQAYFRRNLLESPRSLLAFSSGAKGLAPALEGAERFASPETLRGGRARYDVGLDPL